MSRDHKVQTGKTKVKENTANKFVVENGEPFKQIDQARREVSLGGNLIWRLKCLDLERQIDLVWRWVIPRDRSIWC